MMAASKPTSQLSEIQIRPGSPSVSPPPGLPLVGFAALRSVDMQSADGVVWFPTPAVPSPFPAELAVSTDCRPLLSYPSKFILPYALLPFRVLPSRTRPAPPGVELLPWGWPSLFATSACGVLTTGFHPHRFPSSAFLTPSTVYSATGLVGLFHPTATSRVLPSGVFPPAQPLRLSTPRCPRVG